MITAKNMTDAIKELTTQYPNYNVLDNWSSADFDDQTGAVVRERLEKIPSIRFFTAHEPKPAAVAEQIVPATQ